MSGYCDHDGEACECGMEIITPLRARLAAAEARVAALEKAACASDRYAGHVGNCDWALPACSCGYLEHRASLRAALAQGEEPAPRCERCVGTGKKYPILRTSIDCPACGGTGRGA